MLQVGSEESEPDSKTFTNDPQASESGSFPKSTIVKNKKYEIHLHSRTGPEIDHVYCVPETLIL